MLRVLVVDDKPVFLIRMKRMKLWKDGAFSLAGTASNGKEALDFLRTYGADIVITDIKMPVMDGLELLKVCKEENLCGCMILMSSYDDFAYARSALIHGAFDYILKPLEEANVLEVLNRYRQTLCGQKPSQKEYEKIADCLVKREYQELFELLDHYPAGEENTVSRQLKNIIEAYQRKSPEIGRFLSPHQVLYDFTNAHHTEGKTVTLKGVLEFLTEYIDRLSPPTRSPVVANIIQYSLANIENNIHTFDVGDKLFANRQYLSSVFFQETSMHLSEYLRWLKISRAKCLAEDSKVYEIADRLGFKDAEYFSRIFSRYTGCTLRDYGRKISASQET